MCSSWARVSTTLGYTGNLREFSIPPGNTWNMMEFCWSSWKFLTDRMTTKTSNHKKFSCSPVVWKMVMIVYFSWWLHLLGKQDHWSQGLVSLPNNCQLKLDKVHRVNRINVISGVRVFVKMSPGNLLEIFLVGFVGIPWTVWESFRECLDNVIDALTPLKLGDGSSN